jgi:hypothetical protein
VKCNKSTEEVTFLTSGNVLHLRRLVGGAVDGGAEGGGLRVRVRVRVWGSGVSMTTNRWWGGCVGRMAGSVTIRPRGIAGEAARPVVG